MDLIIGIGNRLRTDDGLGREIVERLPEDEGRKILSVHQLLPEHAPALAEADRVLFVDADAAGRTIRLMPVRAEGQRGLGHAVSPGGLLEWAGSLYGRRPEAWLLAVPGESFALGEGLSAPALKRVSHAVRAVERWISSLQPEGELSEEEL